MEFETSSPHVPSPPTWTSVLPQIRLRSLALWALLVFLGTSVVIPLLPASLDAAPGTIGSVSVIVILLGWIAWTWWRYRLSLRALFGPFPTNPAPWILIGGLFLAMKVINHAEFHLLLPWLEAHFPPLANWYTISTAEKLPNSTWTSLWHVVRLVVLVPLVEEIFFRGLLFQHWAYRWRRPVLAALASSILFALLHGHVLGTFLFAFILILLYINTQNLWGPILFHGLLNLSALGGFSIDVGLQALGIRETMLISVLSLVLVVPILASFIAQTLPSLSTSLPYVKNRIAAELHQPRKS